MPKSTASARARLMRGAALAAIAVLTINLGACKKLSDTTASLADVTGSIGGGPQFPAPGDEIGLQRYNTTWSSRYERRPDDKTNAMNFARGLRAAHRFDQAIAVLQRAVIKHPTDREVLAEYGKALADAGKLNEAAQTLERAQLPEKPNWSILSTQGSIAAQMGNQTLARQYYNEALKIAPGEPSVLSNLGLSYALDRQLSDAERILRQATTHPRADRRVRQNLALVLGLQGKFGEAEEVLRQVLSPSDASANIASIKSMIAQSNTWRDIRNIDAQPARRKRTGRNAGGGNNG